MIKRLLSLILLLILTNTLAFSKELRNDYEPRDTITTKKIVAYYEGGELSRYTKVFKALIKSLSDHGWVEPMDLKRFKTSKELWAYLSTDAKSNYLEFRKDLFYSSDWDSTKRSVNIRKIQERIKTKDDIDMVLAFGTWAGQDLSHNNIDKNTFVIDASDPVDANIVKSAQSSGYAYLHALVDEQKYTKQISLFYNIFHFKKMGLVYQDTHSGKSYAGLDDAKKMSKKYDFKLSTCVVKPNKNLAKEKQSFIKCYKNLTRISDAIYVGITPSCTINDFQYFMPTINKNRIPTFSKDGSLEVKYGVLMGISNNNFKYIAEFHAKAIINTLNGELIKDQTIFFETPTLLSLNLKTAQNIDWDPPINIIGITKELYYDNMLTKY